jgi:hypothetical protein
MGLTTRHLVRDIINIATSGSNPNDFRITDSQVLFWCNEIRSMLISQAISKRQDISDVWVQPITCMDVALVDKSECCEIVTDCYMMRTNAKLPQTIETIGDNSIIRVEKPNGDIISKSNPFESKYASYNKYTGEKSRWFVKNGYVYISNEDIIPSINVWGIFENPADLMAFTSCNGSTCFTMNDPYPCSMKMANEITNIVIKTKVYPFIQMPQDTTNNANDQPNTPPNPKLQ